MRAGLTWAAILSGVAAYDVFCDRRHDESTLCAVTRRTYHTNTRAGRVAFVATYAAVSAWYLPHLLKR